MKRVYKDANVYDAAVSRFEYIFSEFDNVCISFSNGKDSGVLLNLAIEVARKMDKLPVTVLYIDFEAQYKKAIEFTERMFSREEVQGYWVCLPINLRNAVSQIQDHWLCWDGNKKDAWVRELPKNKHVISDEAFFPFFRRGIEFEEFVPEFAKWFADGEKACQVVGIRTAESLNRYRTIVSEKKLTYKGNQWTTKMFRNEPNEIYSAYPIYDWRTEDIWTANAINKWDYNEIYDLMQMAGVPIHKQRLCQP